LESRYYGFDGTKRFTVGIRHNINKLAAIPIGGTKKMGIIPVEHFQSDRNRFMRLSLFIPRIWKIMVAGAIPFLLVVTNYFEALESTGTIGAFIADTLMPVTMISYLTLIFVLKKRDI
jgi:drug/metabolite transporter (DMT)-like permease